MEGWARFNPFLLGTNRSNRLVFLKIEHSGQLCFHSSVKLVQCKARVRSLWKDWGYTLFAFLLVSCALRSAFADWNDVPTASMNPTILEGDRVWVNKLAYDLKVPFTKVRLAHWEKPQRGDIVVFFSPDDGTRMIKRIIGLPGDKVSMRRNMLFINGKAVTYENSVPETLEFLQIATRDNHVVATEILSGRRHSVMGTPQVHARRYISPVVVPDGNYLVLGDNRDNSHDSRYFGFVPESEIIGRASSVVLSFDREHYWKPRWNRFFSALDRLAFSSK